ncbi:MAG: alpha/beta hydrolase [Proteobacteria bacterium]|nr:alpha/beta hydrolase [Pseudomonadota bacterium]
MTKRWVVFLIFLVVACTPLVQEVRPSIQEPAFQSLASGEAFAAADGRILPLRVWPAAGNPGPAHAVFLALHGFNDYSNAFDAPGRWWAERGITTYAYDQRGFGATEEAGVWAGVEAMVADLRTVIRLLRRRHPETPLYLIGESMGAAVILVTLGDPLRPAGGGSGVAGVEGVEGVVLVAPAVWGRATLNPFYGVGLWAIAHTFPGWRPTGQSLARIASDNIDMLRAMGRDPLVIKKTRFDSVYGLFGLMDRAVEAAPRVELPLLLLYGERDEIIPKGPTRRFACGLNGAHRAAMYPEGYHLLLRDLQAEVVWRDVLTWTTSREAPLPSGSERSPGAIFAGGAGETVGTCKR